MNNHSALHAAAPMRHFGPIVRMVSRPFSLESTKAIRFGSFANTFRARKVFRSGRLEPA